MYSKILLCAAQEWSGSRSWYSSKDSAFLLPNCLKTYNVHSYNVSACYQSVPLMLAMCLLVTNVSVKSFTNERPLEYMSPKCPLFVTKHPHACQQSFPVHSCFDMLPNCNWGNQAWLSLFTVSHMLLPTGPHIECMVYSSLSLFTLWVTLAQCNQYSWIYAVVVHLLSVVLLTFTSLRWLWSQFLGWLWWQFDICRHS